MRDIAEAFAAHPQVAPADQLVAGIERIFRTRRRPALGAHQRAHVTPSRSSRAGASASGSPPTTQAAGLEASLAQHDVLHLFDFAVGCNSGLGTKPDPRMVHGFCEAVGLGRGEVAMVGDAVHDLAMGRAAGVALNVGVLSGTSGREDFEGLADLILDSINDLPARPEFTGPSDKPAPDR